jgi:hypothetical protein
VVKLLEEDPGSGRVVTFSSHRSSTRRSSPGLKRKAWLKPHTLHARFAGYAGGP